MSPYEALTRFLGQLPATENNCALSFDRIEGIVKRELPPSARWDRTFWANAKKRYYARFWLQAGWKVQSVHFQKGEVVFVRQTEQQPKPYRNRMGEEGVVRSSMPLKRSSFVEIPVSLSDQEFREIGRLEKTGDKAIEIVKKYLRDNYGRSVEIKDGGIKGADLCVLFKDREEGEELIEVKGTSKPTVSWSQLKVSSQQSYDNLCKGIPLYRVTDVNSRTPRILILKHGQDFVMEPELRWAVKPAPR